MELQDFFDQRVLCRTDLAAVESSASTLRLSGDLDAPTGQRQVSWEFSECGNDLRVALTVDSTAHLAGVRVRNLAFADKVFAFYRSAFRRFASA